MGRAAPLQRAGGRCATPPQCGSEPGRIDRWPDAATVGMPVWAAQAALQRASAVFEVLHLGADDVRPLALSERRALLRKHLKRARPALLYSEHMSGADGEAMFPTRAPWDLRASSRNASTAGTSPDGASVG
jgi:hypothetical protein